MIENLAPYQGQRQSPQPKAPVSYTRHVIHDQYQSQSLGKPVRVQIQSGNGGQPPPPPPQQKFHQAPPPHTQPQYQNQPMKQDKWAEQEEPEVEYGELTRTFTSSKSSLESDRDHDQFDGEDMKVAKNVENLGDAAYVKAKGTWYRARKCHKVRS